MTTQVPPDVVVVGGGVIGLSVAWQAADAGLAVTLADPRPGRGAGWAAAGMLAPVGEAHFGEDALTALNVGAARAWPGFARALQEASGRSVHYVADGTLLIAADPSDRAATDDLLAYRLALGLTARRLTAARVPVVGAAAGPRHPGRRPSRRGPPGGQPVRARRPGRRLQRRRSDHHRGGGRRHRGGRRRRRRRRPAGRRLLGRPAPSSSPPAAGRGSSGGSPTGSFLRCGRSRD